MQFGEYAFRFLMYALFGLSLEVVFSVVGIERISGTKVDRRVPRKYLEGFVSLYMIPIHGFGILFGFENLLRVVADLHWIIRLLIWSIAISATEALAGFIYHKTLGFYPWDYYKMSRYRVFRNGYTLWTLVPLWGIAGLLLEPYVKIVSHMSSQLSGLF